MGLFGDPDAVISGDRFFFLDDDDQKLAICKDAGARLATAIGGTVKVKDDGDEVHVTGHFGPYSVRFIVWVAFANLRVQVKTRAPLRLSERVHVTFDGDAAKHAHEQGEPDEWDSDEEQKLLLTPTLYMEGDRDELQAMKLAWDQLPQELTGPLLGMLSSAPKSGTSFSLSTEQVEVYLNDTSIALSKTAGQRVHAVTQLLVAIAAAAEQRLGEGAPQPVAGGAPYPGGMAAAPAAPMALGPGARVLVAWSDGQRYPATVVQAAPGQFLCSFQNGQQQWIAAQFLTPAPL